ncbi:MAG: MerR family transcriptional regulator [Caldilineaceae bacterium]|nr:MerR family transcriptional regulator [Caldilineaceae bacterium]
MSGQDPTFNLKAVVQETGIKPETLRAWERRYGIPRPERSAGGHRVYSRRDIETLHWLKRRKSEGLSISRAAARWHSIVNAGRDPIQVPGETPDLLQFGGRPFEESLSDVEMREDDRLQVAAARSDWLAACLAYDENAAIQTLSQAFARFSVESVCLELLCHALRQLGEDWHACRAAVHQVHYATGLAMQRIEILLGASPPAHRTGQLLLACPPEEHHTMGLAILQLFLRRRGFSIVNLGGNVPLNELEKTVQKTRTDLVVLSAQQLHSAGKLLEMSEVILKQGVPVAFGGRIFNASESVRARIPGHFLGTNLLEAVGAIEHLLSSPPPPANRGPSGTYEAALTDFFSKRPLILAQVWTGLISTYEIQETLAQVDSFLSRNIIAALRLGDLSLLAIDADWLCALLQHRNVPIYMLERFLTAYRSAVISVQGRLGNPIAEMLDTLLEHVRSKRERAVDAEYGLAQGE